MKRALSIVGIGLGVIVLGMIFSIVNTALASIQTDLSASFLELQWMMNCFGIFTCVPLLAMGKLGDLWQKRWLYVGGLVLALLASLMASVAKNAGVLIACMCLFGLAGSIILPISQAMLVNQFPEFAKAKAVALWSIFSSISLACGPLVGGGILTWLGWRFVFLFNMPWILLSIALVLFFIKKEEIRHTSSVDWRIIGLAALIVAPFIMGIMQGSYWGWTSLPVLGLFAICLVSLYFFIRLERKAKAPLFHPDLFLHKSFLFCAIPNGCTIGCIWVIFFITPLYLQNVEGLTALQTGSVLLLLTLPVALLSIPVSRGYKKWGAKPFLLFGFLCFAAGFFSQAFYRPTFGMMLVACFAFGIGWVCAWGPSMTCALSSLPHRLAGIASGMFMSLQELGAVTSLAIAGVFFHVAQMHRLKNELKEIYGFLGHKSTRVIESLLSDPDELVRQMGEDYPLVKPVFDAFLAGYQSTFWFLFGLALFAILMTLFLPKFYRASLD